MIVIVQLHEMIH